MKIIHVTDKRRQEQALGGRLEQAAGGAGRMAGVCLCSAGQPDGRDKVIDMAAWKAENLVEPEEQAESGLGEYEGRELVRRPRRKHEASRNRAELAAILVVVAMMAALAVRLLLF